jgi:hypothetical protein
MTVLKNSPFRLGINIGIGNCYLLFTQYDQFPILEEFYLFKIGSYLLPVQYVGTYLLNALVHASDRPY